MPDYPTTHDYLMMLEDKGYPISIIFTMNRKPFNLYQYCIAHKMMPGFKRWCTVQFKVVPLTRYYQKPCFEMVGFSTDETHRAVLRCKDGIERRYPLIEREISRSGCIELIKAHGLPVPPKSGCFFYPYQQREQWKKLRRNHPDLWCKARQLEKNTGRNLPLSNIPLEKMVIEKNQFLFSEMEYPPCECGL